MKSIFFFLSCFFVLSFFLSCDKNESDKNIVNITIEKPVENGKIEDASKVEISVFFSAKEQIHKFNVVLTPTSNPAQKLLDYEQLAHSSGVQYVNMVDLSAFPVNTGFTLKVEACGDHDCNGVYTKSITFSI